MSYKNFYKRKNYLLSQFVKDKKEELSGGYVSPRKFLINSYIPSIKSFLLILGIFIFFFILAHWLQNILDLLLPNKFKLAFVEQDSNYYQNFIAIIAGIGSIVFALTIFIAESFRDRATDSARVLLRESYVWPLTVSVILAFLMFIWGKVNLFSIISIIGIAIFAIISLARTINVLLSRFRFAQKRESVLRERLQQSINLAIEERIADNILLSKLGDEEIKLEFHPFSIDKKSDYICFKANNLGIIKDINLKKLQEFADCVEEFAKKNGYAFEEQEEKISTETSGEGGTSIEKRSKTLERNRRRYLMRKFHDLIDEEHNTLICVDKKLVRDIITAQKELEQIFLQIFDIGKADNFADEVRYEISNVKDQFSAAIMNSRTGEVEELAKLYIGLSEEFLEQMLRFGGGYTAEQAHKERHTLLSGWQQVRWLSYDIRDLMEQAIKTKNQEIIREVVYIPIVIARRATEKNDHYLFQEFIGFSQLIYSFALREEDEKLRKFLIDRSWRYLKEIADIYIEPRLRKDDLEDGEMKSIRDFSIFFLITFQDLIKSAFDNNDFESFQLFKDAAIKLFKHFSPSEAVVSAHSLEWYLKNPSLTTEQKEKYTVALEKQKERENIEKEICDRKNQMMFGLTSWILEHFVRHKEDAGTKKFYEEMQKTLPKDIVELTDIFIQCHSFETENFWGWGWWEVVSDGDVHSIQVLEKLEKVYAINALKILSAKNADEIASIKLPPSRDLSYLAEGVRDLIKTLDNIKANPQQWEFVVDALAAAKTDALKGIIEKAKEEQEKEEMESKRKQPISQEKVEQFKVSVVREFDKTIRIESFFEYLGLYKDKTSEVSEISKKTRFGVNTVDDKAVFLKDWHIHFGDWGENYGRDLASGEDSIIIDGLLKEAKSVKKDSLEDKLRKYEHIENIVLVATSIAAMSFFELSDKFLQKWQKGVPQIEVEGFSGWYKLDDILIPIFEINHRSIKKQILVLDKRKLGHLIQESPLGDGEDEKLRRGALYIDVQGFSENKKILDELISNPPVWLQEIDKDNRDEYLRERVLIKIFVRFSFKKMDNFEAYKVSIDE